MWFLDTVTKHIYEQLKEHTLEIPLNFVHIAFPPKQSITFISFWAKSIQLNIQLIHFYSFQFFKHVLCTNKGEGWVSIF
jgi:hypothetical protein